jgi:hypothetical protein
MAGSKDPAVLFLKGKNRMRPVAATTRGYNLG